MAGRGTDIILGGNSDYMARLKVKDALLGRLVRPEDDAPASFSTNNVMEVAEGFADNIDQSSLKSYSQANLFPCELSTSTDSLLSDLSRSSFVSGVIVLCHCWSLKRLFQRQQRRHLLTTRTLFLCGM